MTFLFLKQKEFFVSETLLLLSEIRKHLEKQMYLFVFIKQCSVVIGGYIQHIPDTNREF